MAARLTVPPVGFGLETASTVLLVGSRVDGTDYPGSDIDYLAVLPAGAPWPPVARPAARRMVWSLGESWTAEQDGEEVNVERIGEDRLRELASLLAEPITPHRFVTLQPYELRLLDRLRTARPVNGPEAYARLRESLPLERLPIVAFVGSYHAAGSGLDHVAATLRKPNHLPASPMADQLSLLPAAYALAATAATLIGRVIPTVKKLPPVLRELAQAEPALRQMEVGITAVATAGSAEAGLRLGRDCLARIRDLAQERAHTGQAGWQEACAAI